MTSDESGFRYRPVARTLRLLWAALWLGLLYLVAAPWKQLGGLVSERLRWLEWFALLAGLLIGHSASAIGTELVRDRARLLRILIYPPGVLGATGLVLLRFTGPHDAIGVVFTALLAFWTGIWVQRALVPPERDEPPSADL